MYSLSRLYLDTIGVEDNRFTDVTIDFTDTEGRPTDSIVLLRNGAGKTTMMSLLLALIRPERREFLSWKLQKRTLTDLVLAQDTSHVVAEWSGPDGRQLLTGAIYEWDGRQRPADYSTKGYERFRQTWWCIEPNDEVEGATLETLPFTSRSRGAYDRDKFISHLSGLPMQGVDVRVANAMKQWYDALRERNFDPELFTYFVEVNSAEGGMKNLFKGIDSAGAFVNYLLRFVADPNQIRPVHELLEKNAEEFIKRPMYLAEKEFCDEAQNLVGALGAAHSDLEASQETLGYEHARAGRYKRALLNAKETALAREGIAATNKSTLDEKISSKRSEQDMHRLRASFYRMKAAELKVASAESDLEYARLRAEAAAVTKDAWPALENWLELKNRREAVESNKTTLAARQEGARPLQELLEKAKARLAGAIQRAEVQVGKELVEIDIRLTELKAKESAGKEAAERLVQEIANLNAEEESIREKLENFGSEKQALADRSIIGPSEDLAAAAHRLTQQVSTATAALERIGQQMEHITKQITAADDKNEELVSAHANAKARHDTASEIFTRVETTVAQLSASPRLRMLMQHEAPDLGAEIRDAIDVVDHEHANNEKKLREVNEAIAAGERALLALQTERLLPPRLQVQNIIDQLAAAGITAQSGWRYLATNKAPAEHAAIIAALPAVVDGVIVYTDPETAAAHIRSAVDEAVVIASARIFEQDYPHPYLVLGPAAAQHDEEAAEQELATRTDTHGALVNQRGVLEELLRSDELLRTELLVLQKSMPDGLRTLRQKVTDASQKLEAAQSDVERSAKARDSLNSQRDELSAQQLDQNQRKTQAEQNQPRLEWLASHEADVIIPSEVRLERIPAEKTKLGASKIQASGRQESARAEHNDLSKDRGQKESRGESLRSELQLLPEPSPSDMPLEAAREAVEHAENHLREKFPEEALLSAIRFAEQEARKASEAWNANAEDVRARALELAETSDAGARADRRAAAKRAAEDHTAAAEAQGKANAAFETAQDELRKESNTYQSRERKGRRDFERIEPSDINQAEELADSDEKAVEALGAALWKLEQDQSIAEESAKSEARRAQMLDDLSLRIAVDPAAESDVTIPDEDDQIRAAVNAVVDDLATSETIVKTAERQFTEVCDTIVKWAGSDRFGRLAEDENGHFVRIMRDQLRDKEAIQRDRVASGADSTVADLRNRSARIGDQIEQVEATKANVAAKLSDLVSDALNSLARASKLSEFPEGVGAWDGKRFIEVAPRSNPTHEQIAIRVSGLIDTMVNGKVEKNPVELLWMATNAAVPEGFKARILKPTPEQSTARLEVSEMQKWSGGENLTASVILYCVLARMRAEKRSGQRATALGGVLPMDNPIGTANLRDFLILHRKVARANGVQLAYWTAIGDLGAINVFPRIIAMRKRPSHTRKGRFYVDVEKELVDTQATDSGQELESITSVRRES